MNILLAKKLFEKGVFVKDMEIEIFLDTAALGNLHTIRTTGSYMIQNIIENDTGQIIFKGASIEDGKERDIFVQEIRKIDGMVPSRFAAVYDISITGAPLLVGKRRGRKPKNRCIIL